MFLSAQPKLRIVSEIAWRGAPKKHNLYYGNHVETNFSQSTLNKNTPPPHFYVKMGGGGG